MLINASIKSRAGWENFLTDAATVDFKILQRGAEQQQMDTVFWWPIS